MICVLCLLLFSAYKERNNLPNKKIKAPYSTYYPLSFNEVKPLMTKALA